MGRVALVAAAAGWMVVGAAAGGDVVRFTFRGEVVSIEGPVPPPPEVYVGAPMVLTYAFETGTADGDPAPNAGWYAGAIRRARVDINGVGFESRGGNIGVIDDGFAGDSYYAEFEDPIRRAYVSMTNLGGDAFAGDSLPLDLDIGLFQVRGMVFERDVGPAFYRANADIREFTRTAALCPCDWNADGVVNSQDVFEFLNDFFAGESGACPPCLDINGDGVVNSVDFFDFVACFFGGCG